MTFTFVAVCLDQILLSFMEKEKDFCLQPNKSETNINREKKSRKKHFFLHQFYFSLITLNNFQSLALSYQKKKEKKDAEEKAQRIFDRNERENSM